MRDGKDLFATNFLLVPKERALTSGGGVHRAIEPRLRNTMYFRVSDD